MPTPIKKLTVAFCMCFLLAFWQVTAMAAARTFGSEEARFTLDVPDSWQEEHLQGTTVFSSPDKKTFLALAQGKAEGRTAKALALKAASLVGFPPVQECNSGCWGFRFSDGGIQIKNFICLTGETFVLFSVAGSDQQAEQIVCSMQTP